MSTSHDAETSIDRARALARQLHRPVYIKNGEVLAARPRGGGLTVWPNGSVSMGTADTQQTAREVERRHSQPAA